MTTKNLAAQLRTAKLHVAVLEKENADLRTSWNDELTARTRNSRELAEAQIRGIKMKGIIEYLEEKLNDE